MSEIDKLLMKCITECNTKPNTEVLNADGQTICLCRKIAENGITEQNNDMYDYSVKADKGKTRISIVPKAIIKDIADVREYGIQKYKDPENWRKVEVVRYCDAMFRHFLRFTDDPFSVDEESGLYHFKHMACNCAFICEMMNEAISKIEGGENNG